MRDRAKSPGPKGCAQARRLLEAYLEEEPSWEKEAFLAHASGCSQCRQKLKLVEELRFQLARQLELAPETPLDRTKAKHLRRMAIEELSRAEGRSSCWSLLRRLAAGALVLALAFGVNLLLNRHAGRDIFRDTHAAKQEGLSPQGLLPDRPSVFEWSPVSGASRYSFELIDEDLELLARSEKTCLTRFVLDQKVVQQLTRGRTYLWTIKAYDDEGSEIGERSAAFEVK